MEILLENQDVRFFKNLSYDELTEINGGGFWIPFIAIGAAAGAAVAIYEAGKATGELIYHITH